MILLPIKTVYFQVTPKIYNSSSDNLLNSLCLSLMNPYQRRTPMFTIVHIDDKRTTTLPVLPTTPLLDNKIIHLILGSEQQRKHEHPATQQNTMTQKQNKVGITTHRRRNPEKNDQKPPQPRRGVLGGFLGAAAQRR